MDWQGTQASLDGKCRRGRRRGWGHSGGGEHGNWEKQETHGEERKGAVEKGETGAGRGGVGGRAEPRKGQNVGRPSQAYAPPVRSW